MADPSVLFRLRLTTALATGLALVLSLIPADALGAPREYIVQMDSTSVTGQGRQLAERLGGRVTTPTLSVIDGFGVRLDPAAAQRLAKGPGVRAVSPNGGVRVSAAGAVDTSGGYRCPVTDATAAPAPAVALNTQNLTAGVETATSYLNNAFVHSLWVEKAWALATGKGVGVAVIDTGIAGDLADFRARSTSAESRVIASVVTNPCATDARDHYGHGTHVAGLIAGNALNYPVGHPLYGKHMGVAPEANLISVKASDDDGNTTVLDVIYGLQFVVDNRAAYNIRVVNLSLSSTVAESYRTDPLDAAVESAWLNGVVVVAAAGNEGTGSSAVSYAPGNDPYVISVGGVDDRGTRNTLDDALAPWSSRGTTQDGVSKPEVLAPGARLEATLAPGSDFVELCPGCVVDGGYFRVGGTSMSSALVAGVAALIVEEHPSWSPNQVKGAILSTLNEVPGTGAEVNARYAIERGYGTANAGLLANSLIVPSTGLIDFTRASFRRASFRDAGGSPLDATWSRASFRCDCSLTATGSVDPSRASFRAAGFRRTSDFSK